jgi:Cytochrome c554 and c-prime
VKRQPSSFGLWGGSLVLACIVGLVALGMTSSVPSPRSAAAATAGNKFVGSGKCKNCHKAEAAGNVFGAWEGSKHAQAFAALATPEAKETATKAGIDDPQKSDKCLKCHVTAFGAAPEDIASGFKADLGVQCESCHGPGEMHMKARFAAAAKAKDGEKIVVAEGEIVAAPKSALCETCHNKESPNYKYFCFRKMEPRIRHLDPRITLSDERKAELALTCKDADDHTCTHGTPDSPCDKQ